MRNGADLLGKICELQVTPLLVSPATPFNQHREPGAVGIRNRGTIHDDRGAAVAYKTSDAGFTDAPRGPECQRRTDSDVSGRRDAHLWIKLAQCSYCAAGSPAGRAPDSSRVITASRPFWSICAAKSSRQLFT